MGVAVGSLSEATGAATGQAIGLIASGLIVYRVPAENRTITLVRENRTIAIASEQRVLNTAAESRTYSVPSETRTLRVAA